MSFAPKKINEKQKEILVEFMNSNYAFLFGKFANSCGKKSKDDKWNDLTTKLNEMGPPSKDTTLWKKVRE